MELQRGVCSLCLESTRVLSSSDAEELCNCLPGILSVDFLTESAFQKIRKGLKFCPICCYKIQVASETKNLLDEVGSANKADYGSCYFCKTDKCVIKMENTWKYFNERAEGLVDHYDFPVFVCPKCVFHLDIIFSFRTKLVLKFPFLAIQKKKSGVTPQKQNDTPKRKSESKSPPSSKKRKIFDNCFSYLQPLCNNNNYHVDDELKRDKRLYKKIAYVALKNVRDIETPKMRPKIKIKLKPKKEKRERQKCKSEELPNKSGRHRKIRRYSVVETIEVGQDNPDETPKTANSVPKRRVSLYVAEDEPKTETETAVDVTSKEISEIINKYKSDTTNTEEKEETNGIGCEDDENIEKREEEEVLSQTQTTELNNGGKAESGSEENSDDFPVSDGDSVPKTPPENERSDSDSGKYEKSNPESDSFNGSERKKKRVTFSDEINE